MKNEYMKIFVFYIFMNFASSSFSDTQDLLSYPKHM